jgi:two-component system, chemotaxis family, CheB/CheR fusion protein
LGEELRLWVAGCASGEEAYSLAILVNDALLGQKATRRLQIFATDLDDAALLRARRAVYPASLLSELDPTTLDRHFTPHADGFEVSKTLRSQVMFARHNLVQDPPFVRLDLISCRNVLIYLQAPLQERLMKTFHYALNPGGLMFLGRSEAVHGNEAHFESVDREAHLFRRTSGAGRLPGLHTDREAPARSRAKDNRPSLDDVVARATAQRFAPATVLVDAAGDVRHFKGDLTGLMQLPDGRPGFQLMALLRRELRPELARLIRTLREQPSSGARSVLRSTAAPGTEVSTDVVLGRWRNSRSISADMAVRVSVEQVSDGLDAPMLLVYFERRPLAELAVHPVAGDGEEALANNTGALEEELATTREHLYTVIEELETSNEESQSLNEEIQTANEELQSTNEELEASNEELQASNEELTTVNEELQVKSLEWQAVSTELEGIYSTVDFALLAFDAQGLLRRINRAVQRQLGISEGWLGKHFASLPWPEGMPALAADFDRVQTQGQAEVTQLVGVGQRDWTLRIMSRAGSDATQGGVVLQMDDNTQLRATRAAALRSDAQLRQLVERSAQLVCICDSTGRLQLANPVFERTHGLAPGSAVGKPVQDTLSPQRALAFRHAQLEAMRLLEPLEIEEILDVAGEQRELLASYYPLLDDDGAVSGVCYQALDITRRKQAEGALLEAKSAQLAAEGMARTKGAFLANMSHEIRTPMNAVLGLSRMVLQTELVPEVKDQISKVHEAAQALTRILDDVLDFSKMEAGALRFETRPFHLAQVLLGAKSLFSANAQEKGLALAVDLPLGVPMQLLGDPLRLSQVINNLVGNALKFTQSGEVRIGVSPADEAVVSGAHGAPAVSGAHASPVARARCTLRFSVRDSGIGIAPAQRDTLFEAFTQGDASITRRFGGTGLGLAICQRLVRMMGGRIGVNSAVGQGSEFWFTASFEPDLAAAGAGLELADVGDQGAALSAVAALGVSHAKVDPQTSRSAMPRNEDADLPSALPAGLRVLLAEDNQLNQIVGRAVLEQMGFVVDVAEDGAEALALIEQNPPAHYSAVLMDLHMPVMDGLEATRRLRALPQGAGLAVIALTAAAFSEDRDSCLAAGMDSHISKPLEPAHLRAALQRVRGPHVVLGAAQPRPEPAGSPTPSMPVLPGFDLQPLLSRLHQDHPMVWSLLKGFAESERHTAQEMRELLAPGQSQQPAQLQNAKLRTHALMGSAATIGAALVARASASLEAALTAGVKSDSALQSLCDALDSSIQAVDSAWAARVPLTVS